MNSMFKQIYIAACALSLPYNNDILSWLVQLFPVMALVEPTCVSWEKQNLEGKLKKIKQDIILVLLL